MTSWEEPYIGDESIIRPPAAKKARLWMGIECVMALAPLYCLTPRRRSVPRRA